MLCTENSDGSAAEAEDKAANKGLSVKRRVDEGNYALSATLRCAGIAFLR